jgi:uncharacterized protein (DUF2141 family)
MTDRIALMVDNRARRRAAPAIAPYRWAAALPLLWFAPASAAPPPAIPHLKSSPDMGKAEGACRKDEPGPALIITAVGLKDRKGWLKVEVYPDNDQDFLQDDKILVAEGKTFRRTEIDIPDHGPAELCVRVPAPGRYTLSLLHDRDRNHKFNLLVDGIGFAGNPKLGWSRPKASQSEVVAGPGLTRLEIRLNYYRGLFSFGPVKG